MKSASLVFQEVTDFCEQFLFGTGLWSGLGSGRLFLLAADCGDELHEEEHTEGDDDKIDDVLDECTVGDGCRLGAFSSQRVEGQGIGEVLEIDPSDNPSDGRHEDVVDHAGNNLAERTADNHTDCHVHYIAFHCKGFEIAYKTVFCHKK